MGLVRANIQLINCDDQAAKRLGLIEADEIRQITVNVLVDIGAEMLCINQYMQDQLQLPLIETDTVQLADGSLLRCDVVGPVQIRFLNRQTITEALVLPKDSDPLLGAIALQGMDVVVDPVGRELRLPHDRPYKAMHIVK